MRKVIIALSLMFNGNFENIYKAIKEKQVPNENVMKQAENIDCITLLDNDYPCHLKNNGTPPFVLYTRGNKDLLKNRRNFILIGDKNPSLEGLKNTQNLIKELSQLETTIYFNCQTGLNKTALSYAIREKMNIVLVSNTGINNVPQFLSKNEYQYIIDNGLIISEYPNDVAPQQNHEYSRIIASLVDYVAMVDETDRYNNFSLIEWALQFGKDICAVPNSVGNVTNYLIKEGARLIENGQELLDLG